MCLPATGLIQLGKVNFSVKVAIVLRNHMHSYTSQLEHVAWNFLKCHFYLFFQYTETVDGLFTAVGRTCLLMCTDSLIATVGDSKCME